MIYAVIDTNVLVSASITKNPLSPTVKVVENILYGYIIPVYNEDILSEYTEVLHRPKFHLDEDNIKLLVGFIQKYGIHSDRIPFDGEMPDEKDRPFFEVSLSMEDSFLVTGNLKHFPATPKVITPAQMVSMLEDIQKG